jgi:hypothetical protein
VYFGATLENSLAFHSHPTEATWEKYAFGQTREPEVATLEEHLLVCEDCQNLLAEVTDYIQLMKVATLRLRKARARVEAPPQPPPIGLTKSWAASRAVWATAVAAGCLAVWLLYSPLRFAHPGQFAVDRVMLASFRGGGVETIRARAHRPLELDIDAEDVPAAAEYRVVVVTLSGKAVFTGRPNATGGTLSVALPEGLDTGSYWVRLYSPESEVLGEYGLTLR